MRLRVLIVLTDMGSRLGAREKTGWVYIIYSYHSYQNTKHLVQSYNLAVILLV